jgi:hypothetical protein
VITGKEPPWAQKAVAFGKLRSTATNSEFLATIKLSQGKE